MSSSIHSLKFLLDENVHYALFIFLKEEGFNVTCAKRSVSDSELATLSKTEQRVFVTNDEDFTEYTKNDIFSVVWLRVAQGDSKTLILSFSKLINTLNEFSGKLIILEAMKWDEFLLGGEVKRFKKKRGS